MFRFLQRPLSNHVKNSLNFLLDSQYFSLEEIHNYQWNKLSVLLNHAYSKVPYYRKIFNLYGIMPEDIRSDKEFSLLPVLTKNILQDLFQELISENSDLSEITLNSTGGSTGAPLNFYQDSNFKIWADAARLRAWRYLPGFDESILEAIFWGAFRDIGKPLPFIQTVHNVFRERVLPLNTFDLDDRLLKKYFIWHNFFRPKLLRGYATSLFYVANYIESHDIRFYKPKAIISSTEVLHPRMRAQIEKIFQCDVFDSYGCREVSQIATECCHHNGFHIVFENQYVEIVDNEIIVTNLNNFFMPFIRYKVGDLASHISNEPCSCGRFSPRIMNLTGRDNDNIEFPNGKIVNGEFFEFLFFGIPDVIQYQVVYYKSIEKLQIKMHLRQGSSDPASMIQKILYDKFQFDNVFFLYTDVFDKTPTGKLRFVYTVIS